MSPWRVLLSSIFFALAMGLPAMALLEPVPPRINVRWAASATPADRFQAEHELHLTAPERLGERTWSYGLQDDSTETIATVVALPGVEDTNYIDRERLQLTTERPPIRATLRQFYKRWPLNAVMRVWPALMAVCLVAAIVLGWPTLATARPSGSGIVLAAILLSSLLLRVVLIESGGQFYWPDEGRYRVVRENVTNIVAGAGAEAATSIHEPAHLLFKLLAAVPASVEYIRGEDTRIPAGFFAIFSVLNIWLVVLIARRRGASVTTSLVAGALVALSSSMFYFSRHLLPYDVAMTFGLMAVFAGSAPQSAWRDSMACGVWAACAFLAYAGYWTMGAAACLIHVCDASGWKDAVRRSLTAGAGLALALVIAIVLFVAVKSGNPFEQLTAFAGQVTQGRFEEGWRLPVEYLWHAEHLVLVLWLVSFVWCLFGWRSSWKDRGLRAGLVGAISVYSALVLFSFFNVFVVYGRLARQLVPFFCLIAATLLVRTLEARPRVERRVLAALALVVLVAQASMNMTRPLELVFPDEFQRSVETLAARAGAPEPTTIYVQHIYPVPEPVAVQAGTVVLAEEPHPLQFVPYQYEGFDPAARQVLRATDIRMRAFLSGE